LRKRLNDKENNVDRLKRKRDENENYLDVDVDKDEFDDQIINAYVKNEINNDDFLVFKWYD